MVSIFRIFWFCILAFREPNSVTGEGVLSSVLSLVHVFMMKALLIHQKEEDRGNQRSDVYVLVKCTYKLKGEYGTVAPPCGHTLDVSFISIIFSITRGTK